MSVPIRGRNNDCVLVPCSNKWMLFVAGRSIQIRSNLIGCRPSRCAFWFGQGPDPPARALALAQRGYIYNSSHPYSWMTLSVWHQGSCCPVGWRANIVFRPLNANIVIKTLVGLHDVLRRSKLFNGSVFQPDDFVADCLYDLHVM